MKEEVGSGGIENYKLKIVNLQLGSNCGREGPDASDDGATARRFLQAVKTAGACQCWLSPG
jgi:hypothetical protein